MKRRLTVLAWTAAWVFALICGPPAPTARAQEERFTRSDRDLLIELRARMLEIDKRFEQIDKRFEQLDKRFEQIDKRFEQVDKRFEQLMDFLYILAGIFTTLVAVVIGFAYWDRRTIISQAKRECREEVERDGRLRDVILALRQYASKNEDLARALKDFHLL